MLDPASATTQRALRQLAQATDRLDRYADAAAAAAERASDPARKVALMSDAARARVDLEDEEAAIELLRAALYEQGIPRSDVLTVGRRLDELLARAGRTAERLRVLETLASAETVPSSQRGIVGDIARLAEELGETDRALAAWRQRLDTDPSDLHALGALIDLLETSERWAELVDALGRRADLAPQPGQKRADLVRMARIQEDKLDDATSAIAAWNRVAGEVNGDSPGADLVESLTRLHTATGGWRELGELLDGAARRESATLVDQLVRMGDAHREHLGQEGRALTDYRRALDIDFKNDGARHGLIALLDEPACRGGAAEALGRAYRLAEDWPSYLSLVEARLTSAPEGEAGDDERLRILREAAAIHERIGEPAEALAALARAFPLAPKDRALADQLVRMARHLGGFDVALEGFRKAAAALADDAHGAAQLRAREGELYEEQGDLESAHRAHFAVLEVDPGNLAATSAVVRIGSRLGRWVEVAASFCDCVRTRGRLEESLLGEIDAAAGETHSYDEMCRVLGAAVEQGGLEQHLAAELHVRIAGWHSERRADPAAAEESLRRAVACDATRLDALRQLVALQEQSPGRPLYDTLERLADADPRDLDVAHRAAEVAQDVLGDRGLARTSLTTLMGRATAAWRGTAPARGKLPPSDYVSWAVDKLVDLHVASQEATAALDLLVDAARLPFDLDARLALRHRAATIAGEVLRDEVGAIEMYRGILGQKPDDAEAITRLAELYKKQDRSAELLALRRHELTLPLESDRRLSLRLELVGLIDDIDRRGGRLELLRANLADQAGHEPSVAAVTELLGSGGHHLELCDLLADQARRLEMTDQGEPAARLWAQSARIAEGELADAERAIAAHRRVIALAPTQEALDALARLYMDRGEPAEAVPWLERALVGAEVARKAELSLRLARAHIGASRADRAIGCLERAVAEGAGTREVRVLLTDLYRQNERWEPLARLLTESLGLLPDHEAAAWAREAAEIYHRRTGAPERALPSLERALELVPDDRALRAMMAGSLRASGDTERARGLLEQLISDFGRRRSKERAGVHVELALCARADGDLDQAVRELEQATQMDVGNPKNLQLLARLAREADKLDQAERSLRALLLVVRRQPPGDDIDQVGLAEVLYDLSSIAKQRGDDEKASELLESALDAARQSDAEVLRLRRVLTDADSAEVLLRATMARLEATEDPAARAALLAHAAEAEKTLGRPDKALDRLLEALAIEPARLELHEKAQELAREAGALGRYLEEATTQLGQMRRKEDGPVVGQLALKLGHLAEDDDGDDAKARALYDLAYRSSDEPAEALYALSRVCGKLGDSDGQTRALDELAALAGDDEPTPARADALYRLSQVQADSAETVARSLNLLERAMRIEVRHAHAAAILRSAADAAPADRAVLDLYERVARGSADPDMLLDCLERRIRLDGSSDEWVREAVALCDTLCEPDRGEQILKSAVAAARRDGVGPAGAAWAAMALAERSAERGELETARQLLLEVGDAAPGEQVSRLGLDLAQRAVAADRLALAVEVYDHLRQRDPSKAEVWQPLFDLYQRMDDAERLDGLVAETLPTLMETSERNDLRLRYGRRLVELGRDSDAVEILRDALLDDPDNIEVSALLERVLEKGGNDDALADFLSQRFEEAKERKSPGTLADVALRLGALLERLGTGDALSIYREALLLAPDSRELLRAVVVALDPDEASSERAVLMERLLSVEEPDRGAPLALELSALWERLGDADRALGALELGHRQSPGDAEIRSRIETAFRDGERWDRLAEMLIADAEGASEARPAAALGWLREAAELYRDKLNKVARAVEVLGRAQQLAPDDLDLVLELAGCMAAARDVPAAITLLSAQLERDMTQDGRVEVLLRRSELALALDREADSLADLDAAHEIDGERAGPLLRDALERQRERAQGRDDLEGERAATMRLARLLIEAGHEVHARDMLVHWVERAAGDREALRLVLEMDSAAERWDGVAAVCARLVSLEEGQAQIDAAVKLAESAEKAGMAEVAQQGLEYVHQVQPGAEVVRELLRRIYQAAGSYREMAGLLLADAEHATDDEARYQCYRQAADILVNQLGDTEAAVVPAQKARELKPDDHDTVVLVSDVLIASGQIREAVELLMPAIESHKRRSPELAALQFRMAKAAGATGDQETQLAWLKRAFDVDRKDGNIAAALAQLATEVGDYDLALKPLRAITLNDSPGPITRVMALLWEAKIEHARGNRAKAELWAKKALREDPSFLEAEQFLSQLADAP